MEKIDLDTLLKPDESLVFYGQNIPSAGKLNRMLLAGYYALRWIDEKIDNVTQFMENIMAINTESTRIIGLPASEKMKNKHVLINIDKDTGDFINYKWIEDNKPQNEIDKAVEFLEKKGYTLINVENNEYEPLYVFTKDMNEGISYNTEITFFANDGEIHI